tara:strand:- start:238 stop:414 length:177 start_codon:yes stop_codon:yes gene_type:complete
MDMLVNLVTLITLIVTVSSLIAATTSTPKDDIWIGKIYKFIDMLALNIGKAKESAPKK